jgi:hypothetical protein
MNTNLKAANKSTMNAVNSFVLAPVNSVKNAATNIANSVKNVISNSSASQMIEPIQTSVQGAMNSTPSAMVSIPIMVALVLFIGLFVVIVMFREQIGDGLEKGWSKIKEVMGLSKPAVQAPPPQFVPHPQEVDQQAIDQILPGKKEVFNVASNKYTYSDSDALCKAFGAELATYDQVKDAWKKGADWCNYGWIKGQSAVYPTQESTFEKLQAGPEDQRMACGLPGINGGYFDNPELRFGVNCYGSKPSEKDQDSASSMMDNMNLTPGALAVDKKIMEYKQELRTIPVNPFKPGTWSS